ncbi:MAG TPA: tyrosine-type recombinase/integrase [Candidatus Acidoferrales bacterium]|nr:tyrosine-type recombinase/integrase [Candidatus Acidoferrales bacterium]
MATDLAALLQSFFTDRLLHQRQASPHTIAGYRDCFRLLLHFAQERLGKMPSKLLIEDLDAPFVGLFLEHLQSVRKNSARTRNARLGAIHSFFQYVALEEPALALHCQRVLAVPNKRHERRPIEFLNREEIDALLAVPNLSTWLGRRDRTLLLVAVQTGLRVSELIGLNCQDVVLGTGAHVRCLGKGRKERSTPLRPETARMLDAWLRERQGSPEDPVFPSIRGGRLSRDAIERLITKYVHRAEPACSSLNRKNVSPHVLRHAAAMDLLHHGVDRSVIALWLGHESVETTQMYLHADMRLKEKALSRTAPLGVKPARFRPDDKLVAFLEGL